MPFSPAAPVLQATVCAKAGLECIVYMGEKDMERQALNVFRMRLLGAEVRVPAAAYLLYRLRCSMCSAIPSSLQGHPGSGRRGQRDALRSWGGPLFCMVDGSHAPAQADGRVDPPRPPACAPQVRPVTSGTRTLKDATSEAIRDWVTNVETTHYILGSVAGPHPFPMMVRARPGGGRGKACRVCVGTRMRDLV